MQAQKDKGLVWCLLETADDNNDDVRQTVATSLIDVGREHPGRVLELIMQFLTTPQVTKKVRLQILLHNIAENIIRERGDSLQPEEKIIKHWISNSVSILLLFPPQPEIQGAASSLLVAFGSCSCHIDAVMNSLLSKIHPEMAPHQTIIDTIASLATVNVTETVPHLRAALALVMPSLPSVKQESLRVSLCTLFNRVSEALMESASGTTEVKLLSEYSTDCGIICETLIGVWMKNATLTVSHETVVSLGHLSHLLSREKLEELGGLMATTVLALYKKSRVPYFASYSLALLMDALLKQALLDGVSLHVEHIFSALFAQVCIAPNYAEPLTVKNHYEVLRCYEVVGRYFPEQVMVHLQQRLDNASHVQRVGALTVAKHLVNSKCLGEENLAQLVVSLHSLLADPNSQVVKCLTQLIIALCHNQHLDPECGATFVDYLVRHCSGLTGTSTGTNATLTLSKRPNFEASDGESVPQVCSRVLHLMASTVEPSRPLLFPHLLRFVCAPEYDAGLPTILGCLAQLATVSYGPMVQCGREPVLTGPPGPPASTSLVGRLLVLCGSSLTNDVVPSCLQLLQGLAAHISPVLVDLWAREIPQLLAIFAIQKEATEDQKFALQNWHETLSDILAVSLEALKSDQFICSLANSQMEQLAWYDKQMLQRCFLITLIGVTLKQCGNIGFVASTLDNLFSATNLKSVSERESFAMAVGTCASVHSDLVLTHLDVWLRNADAIKKTMSIMALIKQEPRIEESVWPRCAIVLCLGQVTRLLPCDAMSTRVDGPIMLHLLNVINSSKSDIVNDTVLQSIACIADSLTKVPNFELRQRPLLITHLINTTHLESLPHPHLSLVLQALRDLSALNPIMNVEERTIILQAALTSTLSRFRHVANADACLKQCFEELSDLIITLIQKDTNPATLDDVTTLLQSWTVAISEAVRVKAMELVNVSLRTYLGHLSFSLEGCTTFNQTCHLLAFLSPRTMDPSADVRTQAVKSLLTVVQIAGRYNGQAPDYTDDDLDLLRNLADQMHITEHEKLEIIVTKISKVISNKLPFVLVRSYLTGLVVGLQDHLPSSSAGVAMMLNTIFNLRGHQLHQHVQELLDLVFARLEKVNDPGTRQKVIEAVTSLASHNITLSVDTLLMYPVPYERGICESWRDLGIHQELCTAVVEHILNILERVQLYSEQSIPGEDNMKICTIAPLAAISGLSELFHDLSKSVSRSPLPFDCIAPPASPPNVVSQSNEMLMASQSAVEEHFAVLFARLLLAYAAYVGVVAPFHQSVNGQNGYKSASGFVPNRGATNLVPTNVVLRCLMSLSDVLACTPLSAAIASKMRDDNEDSIDHFILNLSEIVSVFVHELPKFVAPVVSCLDSQQSYQMQHIAVTAIFAQLVLDKCGGNYELLEEVTRGLLARQNDRSVHVRMLALRGLANLAQIHHEKVVEKQTEILSALVDSTDVHDNRSGEAASPETQVVLEALRGLAILLPSMPAELIGHYLPTLLIRMRLFSEKSHGEVREAGFGVLRGLASTVGSSEEFQEQIHLHFLSALVHLLDPHPPTVVMCKSAIRALAPNVSSQNICQLVQKSLVPSDILDYHQFVAEITKFMVNDMKEHVPFFIQATLAYFKSPEASLRRASSLIIGHMVYHAKDISEASVATVNHSLQFLLRDADPSVRSAAAISVPLVYCHRSL